MFFSSSLIQHINYKDYIFFLTKYIDYIIYYYYYLKLNSGSKMVSEACFRYQFASLCLSFPFIAQTLNAVGYSRRQPFQWLLPPSPLIASAPFSDQVLILSIFSISLSAIFSIHCLVTWDAIYSHKVLWDKLLMM